MCKHELEREIDMEEEKETEQIEESKKSMGRQRQRRGGESEANVRQRTCCNCERVACVFDFRGYWNEYSLV